MGLSLNIQSNLVSPNNWVRPPQWLPMPTPGAEEMDCLLAVTNDDSNYVAFTITGGAYYVDWGDGNGNIPYGSGATAYGPQQNVTFTNGSASIGWPGATELAAGQIVRFLTTGALPTTSPREQIISSRRRGSPRLPFNSPRPMAGRLSSLVARAVARKPRS